MRSVGAKLIAANLYCLLLGPGAHEGCNREEKEADNKWDHCSNLIIEVAFVFKIKPLLLQCLDIKV